LLSRINLKKLAYSTKSLLKFPFSLRKSLNDLKEQVEDHLISINENTNEIQSNYEYCFEIESKINKLQERMDEISMILTTGKTNEQTKIPNLTTVEKGIFLALYTLTEEREYISYYEIAEAVNLSETLVMNYITILIEKGIPIIKNFSDGITRLKLSSYFKTLQTKSNILKINEDISKQMGLTKFISE
jgi:biotin operon repressor